MKQLTREEALKEGYAYCGYPDIEWQHLKSIEEIDFEKEHKELYLFSKESDQPGIDAAYLRDIISDQMEDQWSDDTGDDTNTVYDRIKSIDLSEFEPLINKILSSVNDIKSYRLTDIKLVS